MEPMTMHEYLAARGLKCPYCRSTKIETQSPVEADENGASQEIQCLSCGRTWFDVYTLSGYDGMEDEDHG